MRDAASNRSRGFAFVTFKDPKDVNAVMVREHFLDGKSIDPKRAIPRQEQLRTDKLFVRHMPPGVTPEDFRLHFTRFGRILDATLMMDRQTGTHRGFGFVTYDDEEGVRTALASAPHVLHGQQIEVKKCLPKNGQERGAPAPRSQRPADADRPDQVATSGDFDPSGLATIFQQRNWNNWNPFAMMQAMSSGMMAGGYGSGSAPANNGGASGPGGSRRFHPYR